MKIGVECKLDESEKFGFAIWASPVGSQGGMSDTLGDFLGDGCLGGPVMVGFCIRLFGLPFAQLLTPVAVREGELEEVPHEKQQVEDARDDAVFGVVRVVGDGGAQVHGRTLPQTVL